MKKLLALALAVVMMMAIALPVFAAEESEETTDPGYKATANGTKTDRYGDGNDDSNMPNYTLDADDSYANDVEVKYGVAQAYTVTIPAAFELHEQKAEETNKTVGYVYGTQAVTVEDVVIAADEYLNIYLTSKNTAASAKVWQLLDTGKDVGGNDGTNEKQTAAVDYQVKSYNETTLGSNNPWHNKSNSLGGISNGGCILKCEPAVGNMGTTGSAAATTLYFSSKGTAQEGTYIDTLTFTVKIENRNVSVNNY